MANPMHDPALASILTGESWEQFCDTLKRAGQQILRPEAPTDAFTRAEGWRYLSRLTRIALEMHVEFADPQFPGFIKPSHETVKIGADNPDNLYLSARIDGRNDYLVRGTRGTVSALNFATKTGGYANRNGRMDGSGFIDANNMRFAADGSFELILSQKKKSGNWLAMTADSNQLLVRQTFLDRATEQPAQITIERLQHTGAASGKRPDSPPPLDPLTFHENLQRAGNFVENTARIFADWTQSYKTQERNSLPPADQAVCQAAGGDPNIFYYHGYWELETDEALLIELDHIPACDFWNLQIDNYWMESLDYRYHRIHYNKHSVQLNARGGVTLILAHSDPALPNWLETAGHRLGTMCFRWIGAKEIVHPTTRIVKLGGLQI
ncbi:MAG TPA: DUF1214 domain-containing protein [Rhodocyclaceae bacterium]|nr:DUF1214 domain-containing protein [Rhodocyclaceae bacterium]